MLEHNYEVSRTLHQARDGAAVDLVGAISRMAMDAAADVDEAAGSSDDEEGDDGEDGDEAMAEAGQAQGKRRRKNRASDEFKQKVVGILEVRGPRHCSR
jgi:hypothetical protein